MIVGYVVACNEGILKRSDFGWSKYHNNTGLITNAKIYDRKDKAQEDADEINQLYDNYYYEVREIVIDCESVPKKESPDKNKAPIASVEHGYKLAQTDY